MPDNVLSKRNRSLPRACPFFVARAITTPSAATGKLVRVTERCGAAHFLSPINHDIRSIIFFVVVIIFFFIIVEFVVIFFFEFFFGFFIVIEFITELVVVAKFIFVINI